ncbi:twin transmembrane helix small protein [Kiloniella sp.]|uniref:twin transmembrane helix small protein n=1 Tax=Kiloniella sp. TaxID=1938587 RepID=UPI003B02C890
MDSFLNILVVLSLATVVIILFTGLITMARGGDYNNKNANKFMRYRVIAQGVALFIFMIAIWAKNA